MLLRHVWTFVRANAGRVTLISLLLLAPCFWHRRIEAGDIPSHTYNAWLAHLIHAGQAPSLYIVPRWNNILADVLLEKIGALVGYVVAERIVVVAAVLIFFWGAFALIATVNQRPPWTLVPAIAIVTYGWTFYAGFLNFYIGLGLAFLAVSLFWRGRGADLFAASALALLALVAHPLAFVCLAGLTIYFRLADAAHGWLRWLLPALAVLVTLACHYYVIWLPNYYWHSRKFYRMNGADQIDLFGVRYMSFAKVVFLFCAFCFLLGLPGIWKARKPWTARASLELWLVLIFAAAMLPEVVWLSQGDPKPFGYLVSRLTSVSAVLALSVLGSVKPRAWHLAGLAICAFVFFFWSYQDTGMLNDMEAQIEKLVSGLPANRRVIETIQLPPDVSRLQFIDHMVDRACIGKCYSFANYEPSGGAFRIRTRPGSPIVSDSAEAVSDMQSGFYIVRPRDLPMDEIYQCDPNNLAKLCIRELSAGEENGALGFRLPRAACCKEP